MRGKASPWSVVQYHKRISQQDRFSSASKTTPIFLSSVRAASMYSAVSCRVTGVSGNGAGGLRSADLSSVLRPVVDQILSLGDAFSQTQHPKERASCFSAMKARARSSAPARVLPSDKSLWYPVSLRSRTTCWNPAKAVV